MCFLPNPDTGGTAPPKPVPGRAGAGKSECQKPFRRGDRSGASLAPEQTLTGEGQRHMAQPHTRSPVGGGKPGWGEWQPGTGHPWNRTARVRRVESWRGHCRVDVCRSERCWPTSFISAARLAKANTHISGGILPRRFRPHFFCRCSSRRILLEPRRKSHENSFSSPAPSLNRRLCRQTMAPYLHHFAEGFQRAQERGIRLCWQAGCCWNGPGAVPGMGGKEVTSPPDWHSCHWN